MSSSSLGSRSRSSSKAFIHQGDSLVRPFTEYSEKITYTPVREFINMHSVLGESNVKLRVLQFNVLADGLSALDK